MLINDLAKAYDRLVQDANCEINQNGFCFGVIENLAIIDNDGRLKEIIAVTNPKREKLPENLCPGGVKSNILYDTFEYFFGLKTENSALAVSIDGKSGNSKFERFKRANLDLLQSLDCGMAKAIVKFLNEWNPFDNTDNPVFCEEKSGGLKQPRTFKGNVAFCLNNVNGKCYADETIINQVKSNIALKGSGSKTDGVCCVSGKAAKIADKHKSFSGSQLFLISVDNATKSFHSYGKTWCYNSPVSEEIMNKYTAVLNYFYRSGSKNKTSFGSDVLMFWADCGGDGCQDGCQEDILAILGQVPTQSETKESEDKISSALAQIKQGVSPSAFNTPNNTELYFLMLSKNSVRFFVRKYHKTTFGTFLNNVLRHHLDMEIEGITKPVPIWQILSATVSSTSSDEPNPAFNAALSDSIFNNSMYPAEIFAQMILRIKTDNPSADTPLKRSLHINLTNRRVAFIKAYIVRKNRTENKKEDIKMSLNLENKDEAYLLGRLFAVMEKAQQDAIPGANTTIKDRYFASACSTPASVLPTLLTGYQNHMAKLEGKGVRYEKLVAEIIDNLPDNLPKQLDMHSQGCFIIGYYQQRTSLWTKQNNSGQNNGHNNGHNSGEQNSGETAVNNKE